MEKNLVYALFCPYTNKAVYVGQSSVGLDRPFDHVKEKSHSVKVNEWVNMLKSEGKEPTVVVLEHTFDKEYLDDKEQYWLNHFLNKGHLLLNQKNVTPEFYSTTDFDMDTNEDDYLAEVRLFVKGRRRVLGLTQPELAQKSGVGLRFLRELEQGTKTNFNTDSLYKLLKLLGRVKFSVSFK
jgi:hypothetical protein